MASGGVIIYLVAQDCGTETGEFERERMIVVYRGEAGVGHVRATARWDLGARKFVRALSTPSATSSPVLAEIESHHRGR